MILVRLFEWVMMMMMMMMNMMAFPHWNFPKVSLWREDLERHMLLVEQVLGTTHSMLNQIGILTLTSLNGTVHLLGSNKQDMQNEIGILREAIQRKNLLLFGFFQFRLDPPPCCLLESFEELFSKPDFIRTKVPQSVWTLVIPPNLT